MNNTTKRQRFRDVLNGDICVTTGSVFDPISARIAEDLGFEVGMFAGSVASMTVTGAPDLMGLTLTEFAEQAYRITRAGNLSLLVDADDGYGNAINVMRTVTELEAAGVCAMSLEDTVLPPPFGAAGETRLVSRQEGMARMTAALEARNDPGFVIAGRTSAAEVNDIDDAIARLKAYVEAGVDAVFPIGIDTRDKLEQFAAQVDAPIILPVKSGELADLRYLERHNVRIALQAHAPFAAAIQATFDTLKAVREGKMPSEIEGLANNTLMRQVTRAEDYDDWMKRFVD